VTFTVNLTARAESDLGELVLGVQSRAPGVVAGWFARLAAAIQSLQTLPTRCPAADEAADLGIDLRELVFGKRRGTIRILFTIDGRTVNVLHVRRATRGPVPPDDLT
jgi:toxin ParE1/3/4